QTATAEIPRAISSSPMDLGGVFAPIAASAARLCDPMMGQSIGWTAAFSPLSHHGPIPAPSTFPLRPGFFVGRDVLDQRTIHVADVLTAADEYPERSDPARGLGFRTILAVGEGGRRQRPPMAVSASGMNPRDSGAKITDPSRSSGPVSCSVR